MKSSQSLINVQQIPGDTDFDDRPRSEEDRVREKDKQIPFEKQPNNSVNDLIDQKDQKIINERPFTPPRSMRAMSAYERRIF